MREKGISLDLELPAFSDSLDSMHDFASAKDVGPPKSKVICESGHCLHSIELKDMS